MLKEIEMPPRLLNRVVHGASGNLALGAVEARARIEVERDIEPLVIEIEVGGGNKPRRLDAERKLQEVSVAHLAPRLDRSWHPVCRRAGRPSRTSPRGRVKYASLTATRHVGERSAIRIKQHSARSTPPDDPLKLSRRPIQQH